MKEKVLPQCIDPVSFSIVPDSCPVGFDNLTPADLRILEIRRLIMEFQGLNLADRICTEYGVTLADLQILASIEGMLRELQTEDNPDGQS